MWVSAVALATTAAVAAPAFGPGSGGMGLTLTPDESRQLAALPPPPVPPRPVGPVPTEPADLASDVEVGLTIELDDPAFDDPRAEVSGSVADPGPVYPVVINGAVEALIDHFTVRDRMRDRFQLWLSRSGRYLGMIQRIFREHGLPEELAYTAMIESGFSPRAVSRVGARGLWQFIDATGRRYGLVINRWVDERHDPVKSTIAAARYLGDLHGMFGHWFLAQAAYNAGEARVARAIQRARTADFWALTQTRHLPDETKMFVPQILAATVIIRAPARYGFEVDMEPPLAYDEVAVRRALDLETVAVLAGVSSDEVRELNPALRAGITPPFGTYALRLPPGAGSRFEAALERTAPGQLPVWGLHRVTRQQSLADIARLYRTTPQRLAEVNQLVGGRLRGEAELLVPVSNRVEMKPAAVKIAQTGRLTPGAQQGPGEVREVVVRRGDTLSGIAARHGLEPRALARLNGIELNGSLRPGDRLRIANP